MPKKANISTEARVKFWWKDGSIHLRILADGILAAETREIIQRTLGELPGPWAFN